MRGCRVFTANVFSTSIIIRRDGSIKIVPRRFVRSRIHDHYAAVRVPARQTVRLHCRWYTVGAQHDHYIGQPISSVVPNQVSVYLPTITSVIFVFPFLTRTASFAGKTKKSS